MSPSMEAVYERLKQGPLPTRAFEGLAPTAKTLRVYVFMLRREGVKIVTVRESGQGSMWRLA